MKKTNLFIVFLLSLLLVACGTEDTAIPQPVAENDVTEMSTEEENQASKEVEQQENKEASDLTDALQEMKVHYLDVGQAEATLIQLTDGTDDYHLLYDTGDWRGNEVVTYLAQENIDYLDLVIISHPDADHIGQLEEVLNNVGVGEVWMSGNESSSQTFTGAVQAVADSDADYYEPRAGEVFDIGPLKIDVLYPFEITNRSNEESIAFLMTYGQVKFLFTGDAVRSGEAEMIENFTVDADILSLGHHGSDTSNSPAFISAASPSVAVYSAGANNSYGHPSPEVVETMSSRGIELYGTDVNGTIIVTTDGNTYKIETVGSSVAVHKKSEPIKQDKSPEQLETNSLEQHCININTASQDEIQEIIHIGPERAADVVNLRPFHSVDDLARIEGIGPSRMADINSEGKACVD